MPSYFQAPIPGVKYRIKNADYGTFLERRRVRRAADKILLRPEKDTFYQHVRIFSSC